MMTFILWAILGLALAWNVIRSETGKQIIDGITTSKEDLEVDWETLNKYGK
jgi:hypothetical protein